MLSREKRYGLAQSVASGEITQELRYSFLQPKQQPGGGEAAAGNGRQAMKVLSYR